MGRLHCALFAFNNSLDVFLTTLSFIDRKYDNVSPRTTGANNKRDFNSYTVFLIFMLVNYALLDILSYIFFRGIVPEFTVNVITYFAFRNNY